MLKTGEEYRKSQRLRNKAHYKLRNVIVICECGKSVKKYSMINHVKSKKHLEALESLESLEALESNKENI